MGKLGNRANSLLRELEDIPDGGLIIEGARMQAVRQLEDRGLVRVSPLGNGEFFVSIMPEQKGE